MLKRLWQIMTRVEPFEIRLSEDEVRMELAFGR